VVEGEISEFNLEDFILSKGNQKFGAIECECQD
jgi:uncharacterized protein involved in outer membrane biogenesis